MKKCRSVGRIEQVVTGRNPTKGRCFGVVAGDVSWSKEILTIFGLFDVAHGQRAGALRYAVAAFRRRHVGSEYSGQFDPRTRQLLQRRQPHGAGGQERAHDGLNLGRRHLLIAPREHFAIGHRRQHLLQGIDRFGQFSHGKPRTDVCLIEKHFVIGMQEHLSKCTECVIGPIGP